MTDAEFDALIARSRLSLTPESLAEIRRASHIMEAMIEKVTRDKPREAEPALIFRPEQRA